MLVKLDIFVFQSLNGFAPDFFTNFFALTHFITDMLREKLKTLVSDPRSTVLAIWPNTRVQLSGITFQTQFRKWKVCHNLKTN